jgi:hypothetical protein
VKDEVFFILFMLSLGIGIVIGGCSVDRKWKLESVEVGYGQYNQTNGDWQWKDRP